LNSIIQASNQKKFYTLDLLISNAWNWLWKPKHSYKRLFIYLAQALLKRFTYTNFRGKKESRWLFEKIEIYFRGAGLYFLFYLVVFRIILPIISNFYFTKRLILGFHKKNFQLYHVATSNCIAVVNVLYSINNWNFVQPLLVGHVQLVASRTSVSVNLIASTHHHDSTIKLCVVIG